MALTRNRARELAGVIQAADAEADGVDAGEVLVRLDRRDLADLAKAIDAYAGGYSGLTAAATSCLQVIQELSVKGYPPSMEEIRRELSLSSKGEVFRLIGQLEERGYVERCHHKARSLRIVRRVPMPDFATPEFRLAKARAAS